MANFDDLDAGGTLLFAEEALSQRRDAELHDLELMMRWADLHAEDPKCWPEERQFPGMARLVQVGGAGTPQVQDLPIAELAISRQAHQLATRWAMADALDLRHRLPLCLAALCTGQAEAWVARRVARATRDLSVREAAYVDAALAPALTGEQPARVLEILEAKVIEANPQAHADRITAERARRYVSVGRVDEAGLRHVIARVEHGDAIWVDALLDRVAEILAARDEAAGCPARDRDTLRSAAFGWLARPAELLELLLSGSDADRPGDGDADTDVTDAEAGGDPPGPEAGVSERLLALLGSRDLTRVRPKAVVYVHLHAAALQGHGPGVARVEAGGGPRLYEHLADLLGHARVQVQPVIDLAERIDLNAYETPRWLRDRIHLIRPGDAFPHSTTISRAVDIDHPEPFRHEDGAPPGQSGTHNSAPLGRFHHRAKTHLGYRVRQTGPGSYVWRTPHNLYRLVDHNGTHPVGEALGRALLGADEDRVRARSGRSRARLQLIHTPGLEIDYQPA